MSNGIGKRFEKAAYASIDLEVFEAVKDYHDNAAKYLREGRGLLLSGPPGIGKTYAMVALVRKLRERFPRFDYYMVTAPDLFEQFDQHDGEDRTTFFTTAGLIINDLGKEDRSREWREEDVVVKLGRVLRKRHEALRPVFITTNLPLMSARKGGPSVRTVEQVYGPSLWSLLYDMTAIRAQVTGPDLRRESVQDA